MRVAMTVNGMCCVVFYPHLLRGAVCIVSTSPTKYSQLLDGSSLAMGFICGCVRERKKSPLARCGCMLAVTTNTIVKTYFLHRPSEMRTFVKGDHSVSEYIGARIVPAIVIYVKKTTSFVFALVVSCFCTSALH